MEICAIQLFFLESQLTPGVRTGSSCVPPSSRNLIDPSLDIIPLELAELRSPSCHTPTTSTNAAIGGPEDGAPVIMSPSDFAPLDPLRDDFGTIPDFSSSFDSGFVGFDETLH